MTISIHNAYTLRMGTDNTTRPMIRVSTETKVTLDKVVNNVSFSARVRSYDDAIQWLISHLDAQGIKELRGKVVTV